LEELGNHYLSLFSDHAIAAAISRNTTPLLATTRHQIDDFAVTLDNSQDAPAYSAHAFEDPSFILDPPENATSRLHPRAAVILGLKTHWHKWLFLCRLLSVFPELRFGIPILWRLMWFLLGDEKVRKAFGSRGQREMVFVEVLLSAIWCAVAGYLSFFSMDCLMVRW
jgi:hypothetical protein